MEQALCTVTSNVEVMPGVYLMWIEAPNIASSVQPGQFITVRCGDLILRRPFSVHQVGLPGQALAGSPSDVIASPDGIGAKQSRIAVLFRVTGKGTFWLSQRHIGEAIDILGPSGQGFSIPPTKPGQARHLLLVAGGIGIAPLFFLMQHVLRQAPSALGARLGQASSPYQITLIHGASTAAQLYTECRRLTAIGDQGVQFVPVTEDGSAGKKGMVTDVVPDFLEWADNVYACGPVDMYKAIWLTANSRQLTAKKCQVSLEVRMGCGYGACYGCTIHTRKGLKRVCRDGPVFELDDIIWQEVRI